MAKVKSPLIRPFGAPSPRALRGEKERCALRSQARCALRLQGKVRTAVAGRCALRLQGKVRTSVAGECALRRCGRGQATPGVGSTCLAGEVSNSRSRQHPRCGRRPGSSRVGLLPDAEITRHISENADLVRAPGRRATGPPSPHRERDRVAQQRRVRDVAFDFPLAPVQDPAPYIPTALPQRLSDTPPPATRTAPHSARPATSAVRACRSLPAGPR